MFTLEPKNKENLIACAMGKIEADKVITNGNLLNVFTGEIYPADIYIYDGFIAHVEYEKPGENLNAKEIIDAEGQYMIPGLIDSHVHIESSMLTPRNFARGVINHGTTTVVTDPHEIANVYGVEGVKYMHNAGANLPMRQLIDVPSCVPAAPGVENSGAEFLAPQITELSKLDRVMGLAEVMDFIAVINGEDRMMSIIDAAKKAGMYIQGHCPFVTGRMLSAYLIGEPVSCHESRTKEEFIAKLRSGMRVDARESSIAKNIKVGVESTKDMKFFDDFCICTDDREPDDILHTGHINDVVRHAIKYGLDEITAIKSATLNNARTMKLDTLGAIAPGYVADVLFVPDLKELVPSTVIFEGDIVSKDGKLVKEIEDVPFDIEKQNSMHVEPLTVDDFTFHTPVKDGKVNVTVMTYSDYTLSITSSVVEELDVKDGKLDISNDPDLKFVAVINRHGKGTKGFGVVRRFGSDKGAVASTVSHDSHNLTVVYDTPEDALIACNALIECGGGMAVAINGKLEGVLELKVAGLMSQKRADLVAEDAKNMKVAMRKVGLNQMENPLLRIVTLALPVIPNCKMSDLGIVDVITKTILPLYPDFK